MVLKARSASRQRLTWVKWAAVALVGITVVTATGIASADEALPVDRPRQGNIDRTRWTLPDLRGRTSVVALRATGTVDWDLRLGVAGATLATSDVESGRWDFVVMHQPHRNGLIAEAFDGPNPYDIELTHNDGVTLRPNTGRRHRFRIRSGRHLEVILVQARPNMHMTVTFRRPGDQVDVYLMPPMADNYYGRPSARQILQFSEEGVLQFQADGHGLGCTDPCFFPIVVETRGDFSVTVEGAEA